MLLPYFYSAYVFPFIVLFVSFSCSLVRKLGLFTVRPGFGLKTSKSLSISVADRSSRVKGHASDLVLSHGLDLNILETLKKEHSAWIILLG